MRRPQEIAREEATMGTITNLTSVFESLASMRISQIKDQVLQSQAFFNDLWHIYTQLRVDGLFRFGRSNDEQKNVIDKELWIAITAEGGFSGDIDQKLVSWMIKDYDPAKHDIIVVGHHGAMQLAQRGVSYEKYYKLPEKDQNINVAPLIAEVKKYRTTFAYYQNYISLSQQDIKRIELVTAVRSASQSIATNQATEKDETITERNYIFEPSTYAVVAHLEKAMLEISLGQIILDSKLAQYASRFRAMSAAKERATDSQRELHLDYNRSKRSLADERLKEMINGMKKAHAS